MNFKRLIITALEYKTVQNVHRHCEIVLESEIQREIDRIYCQSVTLVVRWKSNVPAGTEYWTSSRVLRRKRWSTHVPAD